ncbi:hypothetical protein BT67DRAFT_433594 [Trichocladium antarcticum]|uniref:WW domain-containing protein n=1 Tax=Trichocladium antarcticum TaxID=1450529 RepID=A0AAN6UM10_9PEZI|nr:hypothetical protein BT67DRAFT_433594 [Trichocladium antarcticum]
MAGYFSPPQYTGTPSYGGQPAPPAPPGYATLTLIPGWVSQFDLQGQRWFYIEQATGRTTWDPPNSGYHQDASRGYGGEQYGQAPGYPSPAHQAPGYPSPGYQGQGYQAQGYQGQAYQNDGSGNYQGEPEKEKSNKGGMLLAAAGGLAVGAIGGALIANALGDDDDETSRALPAAETEEGTERGIPAALPATDADGDPVSDSDRESVQEAREEYEEALADAADSDASSSDQEELDEAREEYAEEYEDTYGRD